MCRLLRFGSNLTLLTAEILLTLESLAVFRRKDKFIGVKVDLHNRRVLIAIGFRFLVHVEFERNVVILDITVPGPRLALFSTSGHRTAAGDGTDAAVAARTRAGTAATHITTLSTAFGPPAFSLSDYRSTGRRHDSFKSKPALVELTF